MSSTGPTPPSRERSPPATCSPPRGGADGEPYAPVPFVWTDQGRHRAQFLGRPTGDADDDTVQVVVGDPAERKFLALYGRRGKLRGVLGLNLPRLVMPYRALLQAGATWDDALAQAAQQQS